MKFRRHTYIKASFIGFFRFYTILGAHFKVLIHRTLEIVSKALYAVAFIRYKAV